MHVLSELLTNYLFIPLSMSDTHTKKTHSHEEHESSSEAHTASHPKKLQLSTPAAIIIGCVIVAAGLFLGLSQKQDSGSSSQASGALTQEEAQADVIAKATDLGIAKKKITACVEENRYAQHVSSQQDGIVAEQAGTPFNVFVYQDKVLALPGALELSILENIITEIQKPDFEVPAELMPKTDPQIFVINDKDHVRGLRTAPVQIFEYSDIDCPFCKQFHPEMMQLAEKYPDTVAWVYRHNPLDQLHPNARMKANAVECVAELADEDTFWKYLDTLVEQK